LVVLPIQVEPCLLFSIWSHSSNPMSSTDEAPSNLLPHDSTRFAFSNQQSALHCAIHTTVNHIYW
jgi:hypothetical protein